MSRFSRDYHRKKLARALGQAEDEGFCQLVWAIDALQSGREAAAQGVIEYGPQAVVEDPTQGSFVHKWALDTLVNELLITPKAVLREGRNQRLNHESFDGIVDVFNELRAVENAEYSVTGRPELVLDEVARVGHRQFDWQRGFYNQMDFARSLSLFNGPLASAFFAQKYGLTIPEFVLVGFGAWVSLQESRSFEAPIKLEAIGLTAELFERARPLFILSLANAQKEAKALRSKSTANMAYRPSVLRRYPCISFNDGKRVRAPLRDLIMARVTAGLYYDVVRGGDAVNTELGKRFETYCRELLAANLPESEWHPAIDYNYHGAKSTPDILLMQNGASRLVIECKAKRMTMAARFGEDPFTEAKIGFDEIAKGILQVWRYFSHVRIGAIPDHSTTADAFGLVITLDPWLRATRNRLGILVKMATALADAEGEIKEEDRRPVAFCAIEDLEHLLRRATLDSFLTTSKAASDEQYAGYMLNILHGKFKPNPPVHKAYPFDDRIGQNLPWWDALPDLESAQPQK